MGSTVRARNAVGVAFGLNGFLFATWVSRIPEARSALGLDNGRLGLLILAIALGSVLTMPTTGTAIERLGTVLVIRVAALTGATGLVLVALALRLDEVVLAAAGLFLWGVGAGVWD